MPTINLDSHGKEDSEEPQPYIPGVVWAQDKPFYPVWTSKDEVFLILYMEHLTWELPALQSLVSRGAVQCGTARSTFF